jgi:hypothetical protein
MLKRLILAAGLVAVTVSGVQAHGPSRKKEITTIEINAPADKVWALVGNFHDMSWHPEVAKTEALPGNEPEVTTRTLTFKAGGVFTDKLTRYEPDQRIIAFLTDKEDHGVLPVEGYSTTLTVKDAGGKSTVEWRGAFYRGYMNNDPPPELSDEAAMKAVAAFQKAGLEALKKQVEGGS